MTRQTLTLHRWRARLGEERGAELIEFVALFPLVLLFTLIVWQFALVGYTGIVAANAAREGARAAAVAESCYDGARSASQPWRDSTRRIRCESGGTVVRATVELQVPKTYFPFLEWLPNYPWVSVTATMRYEPPYQATW